MRIDWPALEAAFASGSGAGAGTPRAWLERTSGAVLDAPSRTPLSAARTRDLGPQAPREPDGHVAIEGVDASEFYVWMSSFAATVTDAEVRASLNAALRGPGASYGRFKIALERDAETQARWAAFHQDRLRRAIEDWLERSAIRPEPPPPWRVPPAAPVASPVVVSPPPPATDTSSLRPVAGAPTDRPPAAPWLEPGQEHGTPIDPELHRQLVARMESVPLARLLGMRLLRLVRGECDLGLDDRRDLDGIFASVHGGILATLADSAFAFAALTLIDPAEALTTVELNIRFLAPCREAVVARSRVVRAGRTLVSGHVDLVGRESGTTFAVSGMTYMRLGRRAEGPSAP